VSFKIFSRKLQPLKLGIVQQFEVGNISGPIRYEMKNQMWRLFFQIKVKLTLSQDEHKTIFRRFMISNTSIVLTGESDFMVVFQLCKLALQNHHAYDSVL
jgi:hypothetical protein